MYIQEYHILLEIISYPMGYDILGYTYPILSYPANQT